MHDSQSKKICLCLLTQLVPSVSEVLNEDCIKTSVLVCKHEELLFEIAILHKPRNVPPQMTKRNVCKLVGKDKCDSVHACNLKALTD